MFNWLKYFLMKKIIQCIVFVFIISILPKNIFAANTESLVYIGDDIDQKVVSKYISEYNFKSTKPFNINITNSLLNLNSQEKSLSIVSITPQDEKLSVELLKESNTKMDSLGYIDMFLTLGIYNADIKVLSNNSYNVPITESLQGYNDLGNSISNNRINMFKNETKIYDSLLNEIKDNEKVSSIIFHIEQYSMEDPDLGLTPNRIVDYSLNRENIKISNNLKTELVNWDIDYINKGISENSFLRNIEIYNDSNGKIYIKYKTLNSIEQSQNQNPMSKELAFIIFLLFIIYIAYLTLVSKKQ